MTPRLAHAVLVVALLVPASLGAAPVDSIESRNVAGAHLQRLGATGHTVAAPAAIARDGKVLARIHPLVPCGYVVVAADDDLPPVIAYSLTADYPADAPQDNPLGRLVMVDLSARLAAGDRLDAAVRAAWRADWSDLRAGTKTALPFEQWPPEGTTPTGGWLLSSWTQNAPYNNLCPRDLAGGGGRSVAGCPSVAMAMILDYHETIQGTSLDTGDRYWHSYAGNSYWIPDAHLEYDFPDFPVLNGYLATLTDHWHAGTQLTDADKAALVFACGVVARQVYSAGVSGTFGVDQAYDAFQRFGFTGSRLVGDDDPDLLTDLAAEMQVARPAHLAVVNPAWTVGHNVVVDGYNTDEYFHLNFGWGGPYNGWYLLPEGMPYDLTVIEGVIMDIVPDATAVAAMPAADGLVIGARPNPFNPRTEILFTAPVTGHARLAVYDLAGRRVAVLVDGIVAEGNRSVAWAPRALASGVYLARLEMGGATVVTRVILAK